jgi:hypothetical protein
MRYLLLVFALAAVAAGSGVAVADTWAWPSEMSLGGFTVSGIRGSVNPDGSGNATGNLELPGMLGQRATLSRNGGGVVEGSVAVSLRMSVCEIQGNFSLDAQGMRGRGATIKLTPRSIVEAQGTFTASGQFAGNGRLALGNVGVPVRFTVSRDSVDVSGSTSVQTQADTPLAGYAFSGDAKVTAPGGRLAVVASGSVRRSGKLSNAVSTTSVSNIQVNPNDGSGSVTIDGVNVTFYFFRG